jgi:hypothetical protein
VQPEPQPKACGSGCTVALNAGGEPPGVAGQACDVQTVRGLGSVWVDSVCATAQQRHRAPRVAPLHVGETDRELRQALPQLAVLPLGRLPHSLKYLVGMKGITVVDQALGLLHRIVRAEHDILGNPIDTGCTTWQRPALGIAGTGVAGPSSGIPVTAVHPCMMSDMSVPPG